MWENGRKGRMRLIDADELKIYVAAAVLDGNKEHKDRGSALFRAIDSMPTAYDVDKVVDRLEKSSTDEDGIICYVDEKPVITKESAVKIVKSGGIE